MKGFSECVDSVSDIKYSPDGTLMAVGSHDNDIYLYGVADEMYTFLGECKGHSSYITHLDFSADSNFLRSTCGAYELLFWDVAAARSAGGAVEKDGVSSQASPVPRIPFPSALRDIEWATSTCTFGFEVIGIWPPGSDGTDVNAVCRSASGKLAATGDDHGKVKLFMSPVTRPQADSKSYSGHSSHVVDVAFSADDNLLFSAGGADGALFQWKCGVKSTKRIGTSPARSRRPQR